MRAQCHGTGSDVGNRTIASLRASRIASWPASLPSKLHRGTYMVDITIEGHMAAFQADHISPANAWFVLQAGSMDTL